MSLYWSHILTDVESNFQTQFSCFFLRTPWKNMSKLWFLGVPWKFLAAMGSSRSEIVTLFVHMSVPFWNTLFFSCPMHWATSSSAMLLQVGWLNVRQMIVFHSLVLLFKAKFERKPVYLYNQISATFNMNTRHTVNNGIRETRRIKSTLGKPSFIPRAINQWNICAQTGCGLGCLDLFVH